MNLTQDQESISIINSNDKNSINENKFDAFTKLILEKINFIHLNRSDLNEFTNLNILDLMDKFLNSAEMKKIKTYIKNKNNRLNNQNLFEFLNTVNILACYEILANKNFEINVKNIKHLIKNKPINLEYSDKDVEFVVYVLKNIFNVEYNLLKSMMAIIHYNNEPISEEECSVIVKNYHSYCYDFIGNVYKVIIGTGEFNEAEASLEGKANYYVNVYLLIARIKIKQIINSLLFYYSLIEAYKRVILPIYFINKNDIETKIEKFSIDQFNRKVFLLTMINFIMLSSQIDKIVINNMYGKFIEFSQQKSKDMSSLKFNNIYQNTILDIKNNLQNYKFFSETFNDHANNILFIDATFKNDIHSLNDVFYQSTNSEFLKSNYVKCGHEFLIKEIKNICANGKIYLT